MRIRRTLLALVFAVTFVVASAGVAAADGGKGSDRCSGASARVARLQKQQHLLEARVAAVSTPGGVEAKKLARRAERLGAEIAALQTRCKS